MAAENARWLMTARLTLAPLTPRQLELCLTLPSRLESQLGIAGVRAVRSDAGDRAIRRKLEKLGAAGEDDYPWFTYWLLVASGGRESVGLAGFKGVPDTLGEVEIGYGVAPVYRGLGYATEAVRALAGWAFEDPSCRSVRARLTGTSHPASARVLEKAGFRPCEQTGEGWVWRLAPPAS